MKKIKYKVSEGEMIGLLPEDTMFDCYLLYESCDIEGGLVYMPKNIRYINKNGEEVIDEGCGCLTFAIMEDRKCGYYVRHDDDYINLNPKEANGFEKQIEDLKRIELEQAKRLRDDPYGYVYGIKEIPRY